MVEVPASSPAAQAGLREGDALIAIDGKPVAGLSAAEVHKRLSGEVGSTVELEIAREGTLERLRIERAPYGAATSPGAKARN